MLPRESMVQPLTDPPVTTVAASIGPVSAQLRATPANVGALRRRARQWLSAVLDDADAVDDLTLAVSEALENAVDHAFVGRPVGTMTLTCEKAPGAVVIRVVDDGRWQRVGSPGCRGRGLGMMVQLCSDHDVRTDATGTCVTLKYLR